MQWYIPIYTVFHHSQATLIIPFPPTAVHNAPDNPTSLFAHSPPKQVPSRNPTTAPSLRHSSGSLSPGYENKSQ